MKKFVMGLVLGVGLTVAVSAAAEEIQSLIGKQVEGQVAVVVDGVQINVPAAIIDGTSYAPVRAVAEAVGKEVDWKEGKVILESKQEATPSAGVSISPTATPAPSSVKYSKDVIEAEIQRLEVSIYNLKTIMEEYPDRFGTEENRSKLKLLEPELTLWKQRLAELGGEANK
ncbi:hypothetical protein D3C72_245090 [compost metagenome]